MRGQKLFVRPVEMQDRQEVQAFLAAHGCSLDLATGLLGKLLGQIVAVAQLELSQAEVHIEQLVVSSDLRRKRIGRTMIEEVSGLARKMESTWLVARAGTPIAPFLVHIGFQQDGEILRRRVSGNDLQVPTR